MRHIHIALLILALTALFGCSFVPPLLLPPQQVTTQQAPVLSPTPVELPPGIEKMVTVEEGDLVSLNVKAIDPDGNPITLSFSAPMDTEGKWQTRIGQAGNYTITISASNGALTSEKKVLVQVLSKNRPPHIGTIPQVRIHVGDTVRFEPSITDPDGDVVTVTYSGWMQSNQKTAAAGDVGMQQVMVTANDGRMTDQQVVNVTVLPYNDAPQISPLSPIMVTEGDTVTLNPQVSDPNNEQVMVTYSGWMTNSTYTTTAGDAGVHEVIITASDGDLSDVAKVQVTVKNRPKAPEIVLG